MQADLENGLWAGEERVTPGNTALTYPFVTAMLKGGANGFALKASGTPAGHSRASSCLAGLAVDPCPRHPN